MIQDGRKYVDKTELMTVGKEVYATACSACHQADGSGIVGVFPSLVNSGIVVGDKNQLIDYILNGVPGTAKQAMRERLNDLEIATVATYICQSWGNESPKVIQPVDVQAAR